MIEAFLCFQLRGVCIEGGKYYFTEGGNTISLREDMFFIEGGHIYFMFLILSSCLKLNSVGTGVNISTDGEILLKGGNRFNFLY